MNQSSHSPASPTLFKNNITFGIAVCGLLLLTVLVFSKVLDSSFTNWDDDKYIVENPLILDLDLEKAFTSFTVGLYTPVTTLSYSLDYRCFGMNPTGFHATSL